MFYIKGYELGQKNIAAELSVKQCWNIWKHWLNPLFKEYRNKL